jgi:hypothetical protein
VTVVPSTDTPTTLGIPGNVDAVLPEAAIIGHEINAPSSTRKNLDQRVVAMSRR